MATLNQLWNEQQTLIGKIQQNQAALGAMFGFGSTPQRSATTTTQRTTGRPQKASTSGTRRKRTTTTAGNGLNANAAKVVNALKGQSMTTAAIALATGLRPQSVPRLLNGSLSEYVTRSGDLWSLKAAPERQAA